MRKSRFAAQFVPFGYFSSPVALSTAFVERLAEFASASPRYLTVDAHVEVLAIFSVRITRMRRGHRLVDLRTSEVEEFAGTAALLLCFIRPVANAGLFGEDQTIRTSDHVKLALHAVVKGITIPGVLMSEVAVCVPEEMPVDLTSASEESEKVVELPYVYSTDHSELNVA
ncbi:hypothetical protein ALC57_09427 [Trachymyrmex cornetzi]|uniref:Uncharacterized protein n=1 Tax=Trachymyrmex cornetzi TaxID=471704 RepID=A0A195DZJ4_9HYME|nr:hypothetical protein ALC57_09427 [Trachymyrmex cornetzi]